MTEPGWMVAGAVAVAAVGFLAGIAGGGARWRQMRGWLAHRRARVLLVGEFEPYLDLLTETLRRLGYNPDRTHPRAALGALQAGRYHIVVGGVVMPFLTGLQLLTAVKAESPGTQVILLAGDPASEAARAASRRGALAVLDARALDKLTRWVNRAFARAVTSPPADPASLPTRAQ